MDFRHLGIVHLGGSVDLRIAEISADAVDLGDVVASAVSAGLLIVIDFGSAVVAIRFLDVDTEVETELHRSFDTL